ncbi:MAG: selenocysteine synthase [Bacteroidetes bacterium GWE2_41_25]|nr:MAG: selenocysteine synthase [Bacteroidetes bacterium GWA2_40_15]OFX92735.1 MAG: selenocysteine synthase [Bacteroidetes bacterium GWE2_41_25]OFX94853.1 MAG: selenocysteine synthase [Bacteroidetes bacterium GWC2_40_22]OFY60172.1 MAG: selenocysteine synthase [Bacteroidetes bacterium GWF2_41_9]HAM10674.1 selenocysteine synthase [Bacteroidales bacterium]
MKRREVIKNLSILPVSGAVLGTSSVLGAGILSSYSAPKRDIFKELGIRTFINAAGTYTALSGCLMHEEVVETIRYSAKKYATIDEVQDKVGAKIAELCHAESAMVTAGCWSALVLGTAGVLTGTDQKKVAELPHLENMKSEVLVQKEHNHGYVHALTNTGIKVVEIETLEEFEKAVNEQTAMMWFLNYAGPNGMIKDKEWVELGKKHNIPTMIDMAADSTPVTNLWKFNEMGFDLVCVSGGKGLTGPQSAGILMGKKDLIAAARLNAPPRGGNIGRGMKVNKEEILGMYVALEKFINRDHEKQWKIWEDRIAVMENAVKTINGVTTTVTVPPVANITPTLTISWDIEKVKISCNDFRANLRKGDPSIEMMGGKDNLVITSWMMRPGEEKIVAAKLAEELKKASS